MCLFVCVCQNRKNWIIGEIRNNDRYLRKRWKCKIAQEIRMRIQNPRENINY